MIRKLPIYMDHHATTPIDPRVLKEMLPYFDERFGNASSIDHLYGAEAFDAVEKARERIAKAINSTSEEIIFTSGATESDNLAIQGVARAYASKGRHIISCTTEHKAVLDTCKYLEELGWRVTYVPVDKYGVIDIQMIENSINSETTLISVMFANNEIGTVAPISEIGKIAKERDVLFHTDAAQAVGHVSIDVEKLGIDLISMSAHKFYGPKGIGALYVRRHSPRIKLVPTIYGGGQERGLRSGTYNVPGIVGMGKALKIAVDGMDEESKRLSALTSKMRDSFVTIDGAEQNGHPINKLPHNLNMFFPGVESKALINEVKGQVAISTGSACTTQEVEPSHVILALGYPHERAHSSVRFGLGRFNTDYEVDYVISSITQAIKHLQKIRTY